MIVKSIEYFHVQIPFNSSFSHANHIRQSGDNVFVKIESALGTTAYGEILPRAYVTGETVEAILGNSSQQGTAELMAESLIGQYFPNQFSLAQWIDTWIDRLDGIAALFGGLELALWGLMSQEHQVDLDWLLGEARNTPYSRCLTIGFDVPIKDFRQWVIHSKIVNATAIKLKVGHHEDQERVATLAKFLPSTVDLRLDANRRFTYAELESLLHTIFGNIAIHSIEDPLCQSEDSSRHLPELADRFNVAFVIDEGLITLNDAKACVENRHYQYANLRIGKQGGLYMTRLLRDFLLKNGIGVLAGSMVGETKILAQASELLLTRSNSIDYVEGLLENRKLLSEDPLVTSWSDGPIKIYSLKANYLNQSIKYRLINQQLN